jgi:hypothetical protein
MQRVSKALATSKKTAPVSRKQYLTAAVRGWLGNCVFCEVRTVCQAIISVIVKFKLRLKK